MIQYIASDLDGTLVPEGSQEMDPEVFELIRELKKKGILFIAASGRQYANIRRLFKPVQDEIAYITENGSLSLCDGTVTRRGLIERDLGLSIIRAGRQYPDGCSCELSCESIVYLDSKDQQFLDYMRDVIHYDTEVVDDLTKITKPFLKIAMCDFHGTEKLLPYFKERFADQIEIVTAGKYWVDFIAPNANKGTGLLSILQARHISPENGVAFGDEQNDIPMLKAAGTSYALADSAPGIQQYADHVTDSVINVMRQILSES